MCVFLSSLVEELRTEVGRNAGRHHLPLPNPLPRRISPQDPPESPPANHPTQSLPHPPLILHSIDLPQRLARLSLVPRCDDRRYARGPKSV